MDIVDFTSNSLRRTKLGRMIRHGPTLLAHIKRNSTGIKVLQSKVSDSPNSELESLRLRVSQIRTESESIVKLIFEFRSASWITRNKSVLI